MCALVLSVMVLPSGQVAGPVAPIALPPGVDATILQASAGPRIAPNSTAKAIQRNIALTVAGRRLSLSLARSGGLGMALLRASPNSLVRELPQISEQQFARLAYSQTGCVLTPPVERLEEAGSTVALAAGLRCPAGS